MSDRLRCLALLVLLTFATVAGANQPPLRQVLVLQSFDRGNLILDHFTTNFRVEMDQRLGGPVNYIQVNVGPTGFVGAPEQSIVDFIRSTFANRPKPDLIVTVAGPAAIFARKYRQQLFPDTPLIFASIDQRYLPGAPLASNETAVTVLHDWPGLVDGILQIRPQTRHVFVVIGSGVIGKFWRHRLEEEFSRFHDRLTFTWSDDLSFPETLRRCSTLPAESAIYYFTFGNDVAGAAYADERVIADLRTTANAPLFAAHDVYLGSGIVGGRLMNIDEVIRRTSDAAYQILKGASPSDLRLPPQLPGQPVFDWRELQRWGIPESRLPPDSLVKFRGPTLWRAHRSTVLIAAGALAIQALLIIGLLFERRARRKAEFESRRNLALAADTSRRETMSALTSTIAHELGQPLSAMMHNAEALKMLVNTNRATPETIREILSDINADGIHAATIIERHRAMLRSHQLQKKQVDLQAVVNDAVALVAYDMRARQIEVTVRQPSISCVISGDPVLLQQVLANLLINAMDAMAETPPDRRHIAISCEVRRAAAEVSVRDNGPGVPLDLIDRLFTPFVTTKPHGLGIGLAIARNIVEAHEGSISARNNPEGGAKFTVTLPLSKAHGKMPGTPVAVPTVSESLQA